MAKTLASMAVGSTVKLKVDGTFREFLIVQQGRPSSIYDASCDGTWLLMKDCYEQRQWHNAKGNDYANSDIHKYLNSTWINKLDANILTQIKQVKIPYRPGGGTSTSISSGANGLSVRLFLLSCREVGYTNDNVASAQKRICDDGAKLTYFQDGNGTSEKIAKYSGVAVIWWLRSPSPVYSNSPQYCSNSGRLDQNWSTYSNGIRPALILPATLLVTDDSTVATGTAPTTPGSVTIPSAIKGGSTITVSWTASTDAENNLEGYELDRSINGGSTWTNIYRGSALSTSNAVAFGTESVIYRVRAYDSEGLYSGYRTSSQVTVINNTAPSVPAKITVPTTINGGESITISWTASTDAENNLEGYELERSTNGGSTWTNVYRGSALNTGNKVAFGTESVMYRVRAYDGGGLYSGYRTSSQVTVINNNAPTAPPSITVPVAVKGGATLQITWGAASDVDGNLTGYSLERQVDSGAWAVIYTGNTLSYTDTIKKGWATVAYRVRAYDSNNAYSGYAESPARTVNNNTAPVISCTYANKSNLGTKDAGFAISYSISDVDADTVTVTEAVDGKTKRTFTATLDGNNSFNVTGEYFMQLLNGDHSLTITANDGKVSTVHSLSFKKEVTTASVTLEQPMEADAQITICVLSVTGFIPADAVYKVEVTNNAKDAAPVWEDCTTAVKTGANHIFANRTAANGFAFNFRVTAERGESGIGGYINSIQGGFQ